MHCHKETAMMAPPTPSVLAAAAAFTAALGYAYWSRSSSTQLLHNNNNNSNNNNNTTPTTVTLAMLEMLEILGILRTSDRPKREGGKRADNNNNNNNNNNTDQHQHQTTKDDDVAAAFGAWVATEEAAEAGPAQCKTNDANDGADALWGSATVRDALCCSTSLRSASLLEEKNENPRLAVVVPFEEEDVGRSFRTLCTAMEAMIDREPLVREDFFNGVVAEQEITNNNNHKFGGKYKYSIDGVEDWIHERKKRSISVSSSSSSVSVLSSATDDHLVEDETEVERLLTYLRFVQMARDEVYDEVRDEVRSPPTTSSTTTNTTNTGTTNNKNKNRGRKRQRARSVSNAGGVCEILRCSSTSVPIPIEATATANGGPSTVRVGHLEAVHRERMELIVALHYDGGDGTPASDQDQLQTVLTQSLLLQNINEHKHEHGPLLLDRVVQRLSEDIVRRYGHAIGEHDDEHEDEPTTSSFLSAGYTLVVCGHSLGAALACKLGANLRDHHPDIAVRVCAFGPPPCLSAKRQNPNAHHHSYVTVVVNNHDCIPRWTASNLRVLGKLLRWTMHRKFLHFRRYYYAHYDHDYQQHQHPSSPQTTTTTTTASTRPVARPRIPPFKLSSKDWSTFWSGTTTPAEEPSHHPMVPGKVVCIWNHSQDPTIIGAKVHRPRIPAAHPSTNTTTTTGSDSRCGCATTIDVLGKVWAHDSMFRDHTLEAYRSNLELLLGQVANTI